MPELKWGKFSRRKWNDHRMLNIKKMSIDQTIFGQPVLCPLRAWGLVGIRYDF